jgi:hypothetical protein
LLLESIFVQIKNREGLGSRLGGPSKLMVVSSPIHLRGAVREHFPLAHNNYDEVLDHIDYIPNTATNTTKNLVIRITTNDPKMAAI